MEIYILCRRGSILGPIFCTSKKINADKSTFTRYLVEMKGVEPLSVKASPKASTSLLSFKVLHKKSKNSQKVFMLASFYSIYLKALINRLSLDYKTNIKSATDLIFIAEPIIRQLVRSLLRCYCLRLYLIINLRFDIRPAAKVSSITSKPWHPHIG